MLKSKYFKKALLAASFVILVISLLAIFIYFKIEKTAGVKELIIILTVVAIIVCLTLITTISIYEYYLDSSEKELEEMDIGEIVVAGGCFWGVEEYFKRVKGIVETEVGYSQGTKINPTYEEVCSQNTNHAEVVYLKYNRAEISLKKIMELLFRIIDPTSLNKQANDVGTNYRTGIYYLDENDREEIESFIAKANQHYQQKEVVVECEKLYNYFKAEDYHQEYLSVKPNGYCHVDFSKLKDNEKKVEYL